MCRCGFAKDWATPLPISVSCFMSVSAVVKKGLEGNIVDYWNCTSSFWSVFSIGLIRSCSRLPLVAGSDIGHCGALENQHSNVFFFSEGAVKKRQKWILRTNKRRRGSPVCDAAGGGAVWCCRGNSVSPRVVPFPPPKSAQSCQTIDTRVASSIHSDRVSDWPRLIDHNQLDQSSGVGYASHFRIVRWF